LEIFQSKVLEEVIIQREFWWIAVLKSREFGYNSSASSRKAEGKLKLTKRFL